MGLRTVSAAEIREQVIGAIGEICCRPTPETADLLRAALNREKDELARDMLQSILLNHQIAAEEALPLCQDTGLLVVFAELGSELLITGGILPEIISAAAASAWQKFYLRDSIAPDPLRGKTLLPPEAKPGSSAARATSGLPFILHLDQVAGNRLTLHLALKGGGAENCGALQMFNPGASLGEIEDFIVRTVVEAGGKPCPPVFVGVGIGGDFESCAILAKRALLLPPHNEPDLQRMERRLLDRINLRGRGVMGCAGSTTALRVSILTRPCHIASLPVAVNIDCHAHRVTSRVI